MTDQTTVESPGTVPVSTTINDGTIPEASGSGIRSADLGQDKPEPPKKPESVRDTLESVKKDIDKAEKAEAPEPEDKPKVEAKAEPKKADEKPEASKPEAKESEAPKPASGRDGDEPRQSEGRKHVDPPARFLPEARTKWANVPNEVKAEVHRVSQEYETELSQSREARERYEPIRQFDELARSNGRDLRQSLEKVVQIENALASNPLAGLEMILREVGPRKPDGTPMNLMDVVRHVSQMQPDQLQAAMQQPQQQQRQPDPEVAQLRQEIEAMKAQSAEAELMPLVDRFAATNPDYHALEPQMAEILRSGVIEKLFGTGLSPEQRLAEAYRMAGGSPSQSGTAQELPASTPARPEHLDAGTKSVRGAPNGGSDPVFDRPNVSTRDLLRDEMRKLRS